MIIFLGRHLKLGFRCSKSPGNFEFQVATLKAIIFLLLLVFLKTSLILNNCKKNKEACQMAIGDFF